MSAVGASAQLGDQGIEVLLVEDNPIAAAVLREHVLEFWPSAGVHEESSLTGAIAQVRSKRWDVVLLDLGLPECEGLQALQTLRNHDRAAPIVVITAHEDAAMAAEALEEEAQDYLSKDEIDAATLARSIRYAISRQQILVRMQHLIVDARAQERNLHEMLRRSADGVLVFDANERVCFVNAAAEPMFDRPAGQMLGERLPEVDLDAERAEIEVQTGDGLRVLDVRVVPLDWQGMPCQMALVRDQTERRRSEELRAQLQRSERLASIGKLAAGIAHEINNPLTYVMGGLDIMRREFQKLRDQGVDTERLQALCEGAIEGTERVAGIVRDLSVFSRRDSEEGARPTDLHEVIDSALKMVQPQLQHRARVERQYGELDMVVGQPGRLSQVFVNLFVNAAHAIEEGRVEANRLCVRTWQDDGLAHVAVEDSGCGVAPDAVQHLFEPFYTTKSAGEGTGLGLYVCRSIVDSYGGDMDIRSELNAGTEVHVQLPVWVGSEAAHAPKHPSPPPEAWPRPGRVLVVDDEARIRALLVDMLSPEHDVVTRSSGREAQALLEMDQRFDMVLCDIVMDDISGLELERWIKSHAPSLISRLLFMTGGGIGGASAATSAGLEGRVIEKPFRREEVYRKLYLFLRSRTPVPAGSTGRPERPGRAKHVPG